jgi:glutathione S-transferase
MNYPILYSFKRCPYAMRARMALKLAEIKCEIREVRLNNKPEHMLKISPKGTVPVLILENRIIDESIEIIDWVLENNQVFDRNLSDTNIEFTEETISIFDNQFKHHLDRYKYSTRYRNINVKDHQKQCMTILKSLDKKITNTRWFINDNLNKLDISILPFIRQFRIADSQWFDKQKEIKSVQRVLNNFLESELFKDVMFAYDEWRKDSKAVFFP